MLVKTFKNRSIKYNYLGIYQCHLLDDDHLIIVDGNHADIVIDTSSFVYISNDVWDKITEVYNGGTDISSIAKMKYAYIEHVRQNRYHIKINNICVAFFYSLGGFNHRYYRVNHCSVVTNKKHISYVKNLMETS